LIGDHPLSTLSPESYIFYALFSIPLPSSNQCIVIPNVPVLEWNSPSSSCTNNLILQRPSTQNELPLFEYDIGQVIDILGIDHLIQLWTCLLLERQVLIHSKGNIFINLQTVKETQKHCAAFFFRLQSFNAGGRVVDRLVVSILVAPRLRTYPTSGYVQFSRRSRAFLNGTYHIAS
jgi:hypothetical protein